MSTAVLSHPPDVSESCDSAAEDIRPDQLGQYSVADETFLWSAARELERRCARNGTSVPPEILSQLQLQADAQNARSLVHSLLAIEDLAERRWAVCQMVHAIVRLK